MTVTVSGPMFVAAYLLIAIVLYLTGIILVRRDTTGHMTVPSDERLGPYHVAILAGSRLDAVKTAIVSLVHQGFATTGTDSPGSRNPRYYIALAKKMGRPTNRIEAGVLDLLSPQRQELYLFLPRATSMSEVGNDLQALEEELEESRLLRTRVDTMHTLKIGTVVLVVLMLLGVAGAGITDLGFVLLLVVLFSCIFVIPFFWMAVGAETNLGRRTMKALKKRYLRPAKGGVAPGNVDYRYMIAVNGAVNGSRLMDIHLPPMAWTGYGTPPAGISGSGSSTGARACPNCGGTSHEWRKRMNQACVWTCLGCGCQFNAPMPEVSTGGGGGGGCCGG